jgi:hypothetical protein
MPSLPTPEFNHQVVDHAVEYVRGVVHTNAFGNYFSLLERTIKGTYVSVEPFHLRPISTSKASATMNVRALTRSVPDCAIFGHGKRLTYKELTGNAAETPIGAPRRQGRTRDEMISLTMKP